MSIESPVTEAAVSASPSPLRLLLASVVGFVGGLAVAGLVGTALASAGASFNHVTQGAIAAFFVAGGAIAMLIYDRGKIRYHGDGASPMVSLGPGVDPGLEGFAAALRGPAPAPRWNLRLVALLGLVWLASIGLRKGGHDSIGSTFVLFVVIGIHEAGHLAAMRVFGFRDTRVFLIPFFGGAATGTKEDASPAQRAAVLLAGPLPGILLALALPILFSGSRGGGAYSFALTSVAVNAFNLLPLFALDGGQLVGLLAARWPRIEAVLSLAMAVSLVAFGVAWHEPILWGLGGGGVLSLRSRYRAAALAVRLKRSYPGTAPKLEDANEDYIRELHRESIVAVTGKRSNALTRVAWARGVHSRVVSVHPELGASVAIAGAYLAALFLAAVAAAFVISHKGRF